MACVLFCVLSCLSTLLPHVESATSGPISYPTQSEAFVTSAFPFYLVVRPLPMSLVFSSCFLSVSFACFVWRHRYNTCFG